MTEASFQGAVVEYAVLTGWLAYHTFDSRHSVKGFPDLVLVRERVLYRELKTESGRLGPRQQEWLDRLTAAGQDVKVWRPSDWPEILDALAHPQRRAAA